MRIALYGYYRYYGYYTDKPMSIDANTAPAEGYQSRPRLTKNFCKDEED